MSSPVVTDLELQKLTTKELDLALKRAQTQINNLGIENASLRHQLNTVKIPIGITEALRTMSDEQLIADAHRPPTTPYAIVLAERLKIAIEKQKEK